jgi:hypothetical protein
MMKGKAREECADPRLPSVRLMLKIKGERMNDAQSHRRVLSFVKQEKKMSRKGRMGTR